jgi:Protein of unknown function (DUF3618)
MTAESQNTSAGLDARAPAARPARSAAQIEAEIERTRQRLASTVDAISVRVKPANVARRTLGSAKAQLVEPDGSVRTTRVAALTIGVLAVVALATWRRSR